MNEQLCPKCGNKTESVPLGPNDIEEVCWSCGWTKLLGNNNGDD